MKISSLVVVALMLAMAKTEEKVDAAQMTTWIKARGTFSVSLVDLDQVSNEAAQKKGEAAKDSVSPEALGVNLGDAAVAAVGGNVGDEYNLFTNNKIELPLVCNPSAFPKEDYVKWDRLASIATGGTTLMNCWNKAAKAKGPVEYREMPALKASGLAEFYKCASENYSAKMSPEYIQVPDAQADPPALLTVATFGDFTRTDIAWLEMWVFMCTKAQQPSESYYLAKDPAAMKALMEEKAARISTQQKNKANAQIADAKEDLSKKMEDVASGKIAPTAKATRLSKNPLSYGNLQRLAKLNEKFEHQAKKNKQVEHMIEQNARSFNRQNKKANQKRLKMMKLNKKNPELAMGLQQMFQRAQDPQLIAELKKYQNRRMAKKSKKKTMKH